jgi:hypothetical protein
MAKSMTKKKPQMKVPHKTNCLGDYELDLEKYQSEAIKNVNWKLGDWCICEMEIKQITQIDKDTLLPTTVSCGYFNTGCSDWTPHLFPLTLRNKTIAAFYRRLYDELHKKCRNLNFPDLNRYFWSKCDECLSAKEPDKVGKMCEEIQRFQESIISATDNALSTRIDGVEIFRR